MESLHLHSNLHYQSRAPILLVIFRKWKPGMTAQVNRINKQ